MPIREFGQKYNKNIHKSPLIITKGGKKAFVVLPYSDYEAIQQAFNPPINNVQLQPPESTTEIITTIPILEKLKRILTFKIF